MTRPGPSWPWWRWAVMGLSVLALGLSGYLAWHYLTGGSVIGCSGVSSCDQVLNSRWSTVGGVLPVSGLAVGAYWAILIAGFCIGPATSVPVRRLAWRAMLVLTSAAAGSAVWFIIVQKWIIGSFCPYCMAAHITGLVLAALIIWRAPKEFDNHSNNSRHIRPVPAIGFASSGLGLAGLLAVSQIVFTPPATYRAGQSQSNQPALSPRDIPLVGSPNAAYVVTLLFDYKCPHCQQLHFLLDDVVRRYNGKLAFALCPTPLNRECNPYIPRDVDEFKDSCELAKVGLAVWVAKREAFPAFDQWMFSLESGDHWHPRSLDAAKAKAGELVGQEKFDAALADRWVNEYLQMCIQIYGETGGTAVPKLVFGSRWVTPELYDADDLAAVLHESLGVPKP